jgi:hypothetical protein
MERRDKHLSTTGRVRGSKKVRTYRMRVGAAGNERIKILVVNGTKLLRETIWESATEQLWS